MEELEKEINRRTKAYYVVDKTSGIPVDVLILLESFFLTLFFTVIAVSMLYMFCAMKKSGYILVLCLIDIEICSRMNSDLSPS